MAALRRPQLVLLRHGESTWNALGLFTGWEDVPLSPLGLAEAHGAADALRAAGLSEFDAIYTSVLRRAVVTASVVADDLGASWLPVTKLWRLNERHYGALQGLDKAATAALHGEAQVKVWRRSYATPPPPVGAGDARHPSHDRRYARVPPGELPAGESLAATVERVAPAWAGELRPALARGERLLVVAHGNSLRALIKLLEDTPEGELAELNLPTAVPVAITLDDACERVVERRFIGDADEVAARAAAVAAQAAAPPAGARGGAPAGCGAAVTT